MLCVDNYFTGSKANVLACLDNPRFELMRHDVTFPLYVEVDEIYNLACPASPIHYQFDPVQTTKTSVHGAINMLGLAKRVKAKIFQASTSEVYGDPTVHPQTEDYRGNVNPIGPRACYDEGKRCAETLFFDYHRQHKLRIRVASPMTAADHVKAIHVMAERNPRPLIASFHLGPASGRAEVATRVRLSGSQNVTVLAAHSDGSFRIADARVVVTTGACLDESL